jgi:quercetin dioxygenase-like cupin family protein
MTEPLSIDDLAALDALGILPEDESASLARLLAGSGAAAFEDARLYREAVTQLAVSLEPVAPPAEVKLRILASIRGRATTLDESLPAAEASRTVRQQEGAWRPLPVPGCRFKKLSSDTERNTVTLLMQIDPSTILPAHDHNGSEDTYVISGSCRIGAVALSMGDFHHVDAGAHHGNVVSDEGCLLMMIVDYRDYRAA